MAYDPNKPNTIWSKKQNEEFVPSGVSGAARGQGGGGSRGGNSRGVFEQYTHLTPEQRREAAKQRRLAKKGLTPSIDGTIFMAKIEDTLSRYEAAFTKLTGQNAPGHLVIKRGDQELSIEVKNVGPYKFTVDNAQQSLKM